ncbi:hypothetical protein CYMTET_35116 [Cymbomonas tetramitiformis]|uniref:Uncharacterized protein n=1 Tax=Cymbomonas tetramitiformis TaxID=36881 RepID=A0AAE0F9R6_9CHLO|nr:hypothetical protein CYMTET_35116 [Cymbomonas tetramitiformis]
MGIPIRLSQRSFVRPVASADHQSSSRAYAPTCAGAHPQTETRLTSYKPQTISSARTSIVHRSHIQSESRGLASSFQTRVAAHTPAEFVTFGDQECVHLLELDVKASVAECYDFFADLDSIKNCVDVFRDWEEDPDDPDSVLVTMLYRYANLPSLELKFAAMCAEKVPVRATTPVGRTLPSRTVHALPPILFSAVHALPTISLSTVHTLPAIDFSLVPRRDLT